MLLQAIARTPYKVHDMHKEKCLSALHDYAYYKLQAKSEILVWYFTV